MTALYKSIMSKQGRRRIIQAYLSLWHQENSYLKVKVPTAPVQLDINWPQINLGWKTGEGFLTMKPVRLWNRVPIGVIKL